MIFVYCMLGFSAFMSFGAAFFTRGTEVNPTERTGFDRKCASGSAKIGDRIIMFFTLFITSFITPLPYIAGLVGLIIYKIFF